MNKGRACDMIWLLEKTKNYGRIERKKTKKKRELSEASKQREARNKDEVYE